MIAVLDHLLNLTGAGVRAEAGPELDSLGLSERGDRALDQDAVGHHDPVGAADKRRVEETLLPDHALRLPGEDAPLEPDAFADAERSVRDQHDAREHVAEDLLGGEADHHRREAAAKGEGLRFDAGDAQCDDGDDHDRQQPQQEADRPGCPRLQPSVEGGCEAAPEGSGERPAEQDQQDDSRDPDLVPVAGEPRLALGEDDEDHSDQCRGDQRGDASPPGGRLIDLGPQPDLAPDLGPRLEGGPRAWQPPAEHPVTRYPLFGALPSRLTGQSVGTAKECRDACRRRTAQLHGRIRPQPRGRGATRSRRGRRRRGARRPAREVDRAGLTGGDSRVG